MDLKTYHGNSMAEALAKVKKDLGREAVILHTRTIRRGGWLGFGGRTLVEITAGRDINVLPPGERRVLMGPNGGSRGATAAPKPPARPGAAAASPPAGPDGVGATIRDEMAELRSMVRELLQRPAMVAPPKSDGPADVPPELTEYYTTLLQNEVAEELAREIMSQARDRLAQCKARAGKLATDAAALQQLVPAVMLETIERMIPPTEPVQLAQEGTTYVALVGPTGVGKTTTIAKLAAHFKLRENRRVGLITIDTYRIAAVEQLRAYAEILAVPVEIVLAPSDMTAALERLRGCDVVLVDTSGRSQNDAARLAELKAFLDAARSLGQLQTHLVLSCTANPRQLMEVAQRFAALGVDHVVFTKLDEAVGLGVIFNVLRRLNLQLSYLTTGQDVPDDIEVGHRRRIAQMILDRGADVRANASPTVVDHVA